MNLPLLMKIGPALIFFSDVNFTLNSPLVLCILLCVKVKPTGVLKLFCDHPYLTWERVNYIPSRPLPNITKGPQYAVRLNFASSIQADIDFRHCLSPYCFIDQAVTSCREILIKGPCFIFAHTEIGGGASFALLDTESKFGVLLLHPPVLAFSNVVVTPLKAL